MGDSADQDTGTGTGVLDRLRPFEFAVLRSGLRARLRGSGTEMAGV